MGDMQEPVDGRGNDEAERIGRGSVECVTWGVTLDRRDRRREGGGG